jgi:deoxyribodipyrimidine photo-lyase
MESTPIIVWFRRDLRVGDNPALSYAFRSGRPVVPLYISGWEDDDSWAPGVAGRWWLRRSLVALGVSLSAKGAPLRTVRGRPEEVLVEIARTLGAEEVVWNRLCEPYTRDLDHLVATALERNGVRWRSFNAGLLFEPDEHLSGSGKPFIQFTAFWRSCLSLPPPVAPEPDLPRLPGAGDQWNAATDARLDRDAGPLRGTGRQGSPVVEHPDWEPRVQAREPWEPGEAGAGAQLVRFVERGLAGYEQSRDFPGTDGTSGLSPHLHFGEIGPRQAWHAVMEAGGGKGDRRAVGGANASDTPAAAFLRQLGWREFAHYLLYHFPHITAEPFRPEFARFPWEDDPEALEAWKRGSTGYPLVDAGMRQLVAEGWMHNRVRMVVASFLTKDLLIPWQQGAAWFWDRLVDADLANNTLGWQWTAGSGPDAAPFFRVFNPVLQARRFDADGAYVARWVPEAFATEISGAYVEPLVDHGEARVRALGAFRGLVRH